MRAVLGLDIGGANLKAAHSSGVARSLPFELWKWPDDLASKLGELIRAMPACDRVAVTMTGELCDCYATKREGVAAILAAVATAAAERSVRVWCIDGRFVDPQEAAARPLHVAAANWLALAIFAGRFAPAGAAVLIDIGSTTTDLIPLVDGRPVPRGWTDLERLQTRELVYTGVRRTPVCALLRGRGAAEFFATMHDVNLFLGIMPEEPSNHATADGRPATKLAAKARLARMLCGDEETCGDEHIESLARNVRDRQRLLLVRALNHVSQGLPARPATMVLSGEGEFLARRVLRQHGDRTSNIISLNKKLGADRSRAACAYAVAVLAAEQADA